MTTAQTRRAGIRKAKAHLELNLTRDVKGNKKGSYRYQSSKRTTRRNVGLLRNGAGALVTNNTEKAEALNAFFTSAFMAKMVLKVSGAPEPCGKSKARKTLGALGPFLGSPLQQTHGYTGPVKVHEDNEGTGSISHLKRG